MLVHKKRAEHSAILVGTRTAELDNPGLNVRHWYGRSPVRIVLDRQQKLSPSLHLFDGSVPTLVFTEAPHAPLPNVEYLPVSDYRRNVLPEIMEASSTINKVCFCRLTFCKKLSVSLEKVF